MKEEIGLNDETPDVGELLDSIQALSAHHRERMIRMILLLADAQLATQQIVRDRLQQLLRKPSRSTGICLKEVDAMIEFLESDRAEPASLHHPDTHFERLLTSRALN